MRVYPCVFICECTSVSLFKYVRLRVCMFVLVYVVRLFVCVWVSVLLHA